MCIITVNINCCKIYSHYKITVNLTIKCLFFQVKRHMVSRLWSSPFLATAAHNRASPSTQIWSITDLAERQALAGDWWLRRCLHCVLGCVVARHGCRGPWRQGYMGVDQDRGGGNPECTGTSLVPPSLQSKQVTLCYISDIMLKISKHLIFSFFLPALST